jgi:hypothetical protein
MSSYCSSLMNFESVGLNVTLANCDVFAHMIYDRCRAIRDLPDYCQV